MLVAVEIFSEKLQSLLNSWPEVVSLFKKKSKVLTLK